MARYRNGVLLGTSASATLRLSTSRRRRRRGTPWPCHLTLQAPASQPLWRPRTKVHAMGPLKTVSAASLFILGAAVGIFVFLRERKNTQKKKMIPRLQSREQLKEMPWESVGKVVKVLVYPVKSCKGVSVQSADTDVRGLVFKGVRDRSFIITSEKGTMITGRMVPASVLIHATFDNNILTLSYPGSEELQVDIHQVERNKKHFKTNIWGQEVSGLDCGEDVSVWLQNVLHRKCKLLYHADLPATRVSEHPLGPQFPLLRDDDQSLYADFTGYMLMTTESIADLQSRVNSKIADEDFRPNILVKGTKKPFDEDEWQYIKIGDAIFRNVVPCSRCIFTTISAKTGKKNPNMEPLRTLKTYRCQEGVSDPFFGVNLGLDLPGLVSVGDEVFVTRSKAS